ncbi:MAG TPA: hypothetical protein PKC11_04610 [Agitococcus sp.]|uniref:hypothetical protein n=1 Tax=uncultured Agitococcus sp. TaxID=1506599 RepID=UPI002619135A|nr:hypothetical protein [uncultured Agitococcus sp.]HMU86894.1 hypothetical protein [Agitococcus sp.]
MNNHYHCPMPLDAIGALALGHKIEAINIVRKEKALSLKEAKALVEAYERDNPDLYPEPIKDTSSKFLWLGLGAMFGCSAFVTWTLLNLH